MPEANFAAFHQRLYHQFGGLGNALYAAIRETPPSISIRINPGKPGPVPHGEVIPWEPQGRWLAERPAFALDPSWHVGGYYVQEAASMVVAHLRRTLLPGHRPALLWDTCAAPGGKSTALAATLAPHDRLLATEPVPKRASILAENLAKWGHPGTKAVHADPSELVRRGLRADFLLVDAPCSGEGLFRRDPTAVREWSPEAVATCSKRQIRILADLWPAVRPGGLLLYSTCTFNREENEGTAAAFLGAHADAEPLPVDLPDTWGFFTEDRRVWRALPGRTRGEGFAFQVFRKQGETPAIADFRRFEALPEARSGAEASHIACMRQGAPEPDRVLGLDTPSALTYLRGEVLRIPVADLGELGLCWEGRLLGLGQAVAGRINNHYPKAWRLRLR